MSSVKTFLLGVLYFVGGVPRVAFPLFAMNVVFLDGAGTPNQPLETLAGSSLGPLGVTLFVAAVVFLGPLAEEALFRGFLLPRLAAQVSVRWGIWVSATIFGLLHLHYMVLVPVAIYYGLIFGWARMRSGSLVVPVMLHMAVNGLASTVYLLR